jgi:hypothetical protein
LPSSQSSIPSRTVPSPQIAGAPSVNVTAVSSPRRTTTGCCSLAAIVAPARPSTRSRTVVPATASGSSTTAVSWPLVSGRGGSGSEPGAKAGASPTVPEMASAVSCSFAS